MRLSACITGLILALIVAGPIYAQPKFSGKISGGFQAPAARDNEGRRHLLKGTDAQPLGNKLFEITAPKVTSFGASNNVEMMIEAPKCIYDSGSNVAYSDSELSFKTTDRRFSIQGKGWRWDPSVSHLTISNQVVAFVQKAALGNIGEPATRTNLPVKVVSESFSYDGAAATFSGNVRVTDSGDTLTCGQLIVDFQNPEGVQRIEASDKVYLAQADTEVRSGHALYNVRENIIRLSENPVWKAGAREGSSDLLLLNRSNNTFVAEGNVYMKLPFTNVVSSNITASANAAATNRFLEIHAANFEFKNASTNGPASHAIYRDNVRAKYLETELRCAELNVYFVTNNQLGRIVAQGDVQIISAENKAFGNEATYDVATDRVNLAGNPHWESGEHGERKGSSKTVVLYGKSREIFAFGSVEMTMPSSGPASLELFQGKTNQPALPATKTTVAQTNAPTLVRIQSDVFSHGGNVSVFQDHVRVQDGQGSLECQLVTVFTGASNQVQRIVAEKKVQISQGEIVARGEKASYELSRGMIYLTGNPEITSEGRSVEAEAFIINRNKNTFAVLPGKYRIKFPAKTKERASVH